MKGKIFNMKLLKKNQVIIYVIAIMFVTAGYLNYTTNTEKQALETSMQIEAKDDMWLADIRRCNIGKQ